MQFLRRHMMVAQNIACLAMVAHLWATFSCCLAFGDPDTQAQMAQISMEVEMEHAGHHDHSHHDHHASHDMAAHDMATMDQMHVGHAAHANDNDHSNHGQHGAGDCTCPDGCTAMAPIVPGQALELMAPVTLALVQNAPAPQTLLVGHQVSPHQARGPPLSA